jgi:hypothetical protein
MEVLVIDVGGHSVKLWHTQHEESLSFESGNTLTPEAMCASVRELASEWSYAAIALGLPCRVNGGRAVDEPANLGPGWVSFNYSSALERPVRIMNDACLQALGSFDGGRMLFLGLGTGLGSAFVSEGIVLSLDIGLGRLGDERALWERLRSSELKEMNVKERRRMIRAIIPELRTLLMADYVVLGGGGVKYLDELPEFCRRGHNRTVVEGGRRLWEILPDPAEANENWVIR